MRETVCEQHKKARQRPIAFGRWRSLSEQIFSPASNRRKDKRRPYDRHRQLGTDRAEKHRTFRMDAGIGIAELGNIREEVPQFQIHVFLIRAYFSKLADRMRADL